METAEHRKRGRPAWRLSAIERPCLTCGATKPVADFRIDGSGPRSRCRECENGQRRTEFATPEGKARRRTKHEKYMATHAETKRETDRARYAADPGAHRLRARIWKAANPDKHATHRERRNELLRATADGTVTRQNLRRLLDAAVKCPYCGARLTDETKSLDHVTPLARGGRHSLSNLTVCCLKCNVSKGAKTVALL
jgi:5-methylcytosine-specific restriction endonuclease McrA